MNIEVVKAILGVGDFNPGFYVILGGYTEDRDLKLMPPKGPFRSPDEAKRSIPEWWEQDGINKPKIEFKLFEPRQN